MLRITCPYCGERDEQEFNWGGESHIRRPELVASDAQWGDYLFNRNNLKGLSFERWCHSYGCNQWFNVARNTVTHEIYVAYGIDEPKPEIPL